MLMYYSSVISDHKQIFLTSNSMKTMQDFLQIRISMLSNSDKNPELLDHYLDLKYPEALYLSAFGLCSEKEHANKIKMSADMGYPTALYRYGAYLDMGDYFPEDKEMASNCFKKAALLGHAQSEWIFGIECFYGSRYQRQDKNLGLEFIEQSAKKKYKQALSFLGKIYSEGRDIPQDLGKSELYLCKLKDADTIEME